MNLIEFLNGKREEYLEAFKMLFQRLEDAGEDAYIETIDEVEAEGGDEKTLFSSFRYDILVKSNDEYYDVNVNVDPSVFESRIQFTQGSLVILLDSFAWNACSIGFLAETLDMGPIRDWYLKCIQTDKNSMGKEVKGAIHSVEIVSGKKSKEITVDFGSAPVDAAMELFSILAMTKINTVLIRFGYE